MSRSYKKNPIIKDKNKGMKKHANKKVRRNSLEIPSGKAYRKVFDSYDISDFLFRATESELREQIYQDIKRSQNGESVSMSRWIRENFDTEGLDMNNLTYEDVEKRINLEEWKKSYLGK